MATEQHQHGHGHGHGRGHMHGPDVDEAGMAELLDLDAEVLHEYIGEVMGWISGLNPGPVGQILDVGCGTGTGTFALAQTFPDAQVTALDAGASFLAHLETKAGERGLGDRITTIEADLDVAWPAVGPADLAWASASLHHFADPVAVLSSIGSALRPGGLMVVAEMDGFGRNLPDDVGIGTPGLEARCQEAVTKLATDAMPTLGTDWRPRLTAAGFTVEAERVFEIDLAPPLPAATGPYVRGWLQRLREQASDLISAEDRTALGTLIDSDGPLGVLQRDDLRVQTTRHLWIGRRA